MLQMLINILVAVAAVGAIIVTAATLHDPMWKKRSIAGALILLAIWVVALIASDDKVSSVFVAAFNIVGSMLTTTAARIVMAIAFGFGVGWWLRGFSRKALSNGLGDISNLDWKSGYEVLKLATASKIAAYEDAQNSKQESIRKMQEIINKINNAEAKRADEEIIEKLNAEGEALKAQARQIEHDRDASYLELVADLNNCLRAGKIIASGFLTPVTKESETVVIPIDHWRVLKLNGDFTEATGKGLAYVGLKMARS